MVLLVLPGCMAANLRKETLLETLEALERTPAHDTVVLNAVDILALDTAARAFIDNRVDGIEDPYEKVRALRNAVFDDGGLDFALDDSLTLTANETFESGSGNCVALANFFVAAVRYLGIDAAFQEFERGMPTVNDDLRVVKRHINVSGKIIWQKKQARYVLDYLAVPEEDFRWARVIPDQRAFAHYYNNIAIQHLQAGEVETALQYLKHAIYNDANVDFVWSNMGVVYSRRGDFEAAEFSYQRALDLNSDNMSARRNLVSLNKKWDEQAGPDSN